MSRDPGHRRLRLHRLGAGRRRWCGDGTHGARARRPLARRAAPAGRGRERHRVHRGRHPRRRRRSRRRLRGVDEIHHLAYVNGTRVLLQRAGACARRRRASGMINVIDACRANGVGTLVLASSSEVYQTPPRSADRRDGAARGAGPAQSALLLWRRQDHQRADGDQLRPQGFRARADLPAAQRLRPRHGPRARHPAVLRCG